MNIICGIIGEFYFSKLSTLRPLDLALTVAAIQTCYSPKDVVPRCMEFAVEECFRFRKSRLISVPSSDADFDNDMAPHNERTGWHVYFDAHLHDLEAPRDS